MKFIAFLATVLMSFQSMAALVIYTDRPTDRVQAVADLYKKSGGDSVQILEMTAEEIIEKAKDPKTVADIFFVKDGYYLHGLKAINAFSPMKSAVIDSNIEPMKRDDDGAWTFITTRVRTLVYDDSVDVSAINSYADLADPQWAGTLCLRKGNNAYNIALVAGLIADYGSDKAQEIVSGFLANRAEPIVYPNDTAVLNAIASGNCVFGITHSYYLGALISQQPGLPVKIKYLEMNTPGVHVNGTGAGVAANSTQKDSAQKFIEFMATNDDAQISLTNASFEFPAKKGLSAQSVVKDFGPYTPNATSWTLIGSKTEEALEMINLLGYE